MHRRHVLPHHHVHVALLPTLLPALLPSALLP
jgi:hypothetical protein